MLDESRAKRTKFELDHPELLNSIRVRVQELQRESKFSHLRDEFSRLESNIDGNSFVYGLWAILVSWNLDAAELRAELRKFIESKVPGKSPRIEEDLFDIYR